MPQYQGVGSLVVSSTLDPLAAWNDVIEGTGKAGVVYGAVRALVICPVVFDVVGNSVTLST
jgi:hypothetical protein